MNKILKVLIGILIVILAVKLSSIFLLTLVDMFVFI